MIFILKTIAFIVFATSKYGRKHLFRGIGYVAIATGLGAEAGDSKLFGSNKKLWFNAARELAPTFLVLLFLSII